MKKDTTTPEQLGVVQKERRRQAALTPEELAAERRRLAGRVERFKPPPAPGFRPRKRG